MLYLNSFKVFENTKYSYSYLGNVLINNVTNVDINGVNNLIKKGADVNYKDDLGYTPIIAASITGNVEILKLLIDNGADINYKETDKDYKDSTPLMFAAWNNNIAAIEYLINKGADMVLKNAKDYNFIDRDGHATYSNSERFNNWWLCLRIRLVSLL
jgi:ankyrin repeat protein